MNRSGFEAAAPVLLACLAMAAKEPSPLRQQSLFTKLAGGRRELRQLFNSLKAVTFCQVRDGGAAHRQKHGAQHSRVTWMPNAMAGFATCLRSVCLRCLPSAPLLCYKPRPPVLLARGPYAWTYFSVISLLSSVFSPLAVSRGPWPTLQTLSLSSLLSFPLPPSRPPPTRHPPPSPTPTPQPSPSSLF